MINKKQIIRWLRCVSGSVLPILFWILLTLGFDKPYIAILTFAAAMLHELGHIFAAMLTSKGVKGFFGRLNGFRIRLFPSTSYLSEAIIILSGPLTNALVGLVLIAFDGTEGYLFIFGGINLLSAISNMLPIEGYDGYKLLTLLGACAGTDALNRYAECISLFITVTTVFSSLYLLLRVGVGYWVFAVFFTALITKTAGNQKRKAKVSI